MFDFIIEPFTNHHLDAVVKLEKTARDPWCSVDLKAEFDKDNSYSIVALMDGKVIAFVCFLVQGDTADLQTITVLPELRGKSVGSNLLGRCISVLSHTGVENFILEVRQSNAAAISLYTKAGFTVAAKRRGLYSDPHEDGFLMMLELN